MNVRAVEKGTDKPITGLQIQLIYPPSGEGRSKDVFTNTNGETNGVTLDTAQGGAYTGQVAIQSIETTKYKAAYLTFTCANPTAYQATLEVEVKGEEYLEFSWTLILLIASIVTVIAIIGVVVYVASKKPGHGRRRR